MTVKWNGVLSQQKTFKGGGAQGATMGILEYLSQSNNNVDFLEDDQKFKQGKSTNYGTVRIMEQMLVFRPQLSFG